MKFFPDTANTDEIREANATGLLDRGGPRKSDSVANNPALIKTRSYFFRKDH